MPYLFLNKIDKKILDLSYPIVLANISIPILGLTDTAVIGQLDELSALAGISLGAVLIGAMYWFFGFLRMGVTGLVAQARGGDDLVEIYSILIRGLLIAFFGGMLLIVLHHPLFNLIFYFLTADEIAENLATNYMSIRIIAAPFAISIFVFVGWLFGMGETRKSLLLLVLVNIANIILDIIFVKFLSLGISGVAYATILAEVFGFFYGLYLTRKYLLDKKLTRISLIFQYLKWAKFISLNLNIVIRSTLLQAVFLSYLLFGTKFGSEVLAANHILLQITSFFAYALDGIAFSSEILVGEAIGRKQRNFFEKVIKSTIKLGLTFSAILSGFFYFFGIFIIDLITSIETVRSICQELLIWITLMPIVSVFSYVYDGIFLGAARGREIRIAMIQSFITFILSVALIVPLFENTGLWCSFIIFNLVRAITLWLKMDYVRCTF